ncbi:MAG: long-chain-fatty-acid--CoA ligase [Desulfocucumaceae bacterium]
MRSVNYEPLSPISFLKRSADVFREKTAVVYNERKFTYTELYERVNRLASALGNLGIGKGDKVAFVCPNIPPMLEAHFGVPMTGGVLVSINIRLSAREIAFILNHSESKVLFVDSEFAELIKQIRSEIPNIKTIVNVCDGVVEKTLDGQEYEEFLMTGSPEPFPCQLEDELENITINYTSGTTGVPKGVMYSHRGAYLNAVGEIMEHGMTADSKYLWTVPMFHCNGWCFTWAVVAIGGINVCLRKVVPEEIYRLVELEGITHLCAAPTVLVAMANYPKAREYKMTAVLSVITAGAPPAPTVIKNMESIGAVVTQVYGLTEVYGPHSICEWKREWDQLDVDEKAKIKARQGVPYINSEFMTVINPSDMSEVPADGITIGEIAMRGNNVMLGYYKMPKDTDEAFRGGWFHSGDLAVKYPNGYMEIKDRMKDIIISGGENISTVEVENVIYQHPQVLEVAVVAVPDPKWGEVPKAFVVLKPGANITADEIIAFCRDNIARFKVPKHIEFGELPKTSTGKIMKYRLREKEWQGYDKKVN